MTELQRLQEVSRKKQGLIEILESQLIWARFITQCVKCQRDLARHANGAFEPELSLKLDLIQSVLDAEG